MGSQSPGNLIATKASTQQWIRGLDLQILRIKYGSERVSFRVYYRFIDERLKWGGKGGRKGGREGKERQQRSYVKRAPRK